MPNQQRSLTCLIACIAVWSLTASSVVADPAATCRDHLGAIHKALTAYKTKGGDFPKHLSDLSPKYLPADALHCPLDPTPGEPWNAFFPPAWRLRDPNRAVSYFYLYADTSSPPLYNDLGLPGRLPAEATLRQRMLRHRRNFGDAVPLVQCHHHPTFRFDLLASGKVHQSQVPFFETDPIAYPEVLRRLAADVNEGIAAVAENWSLPALENHFLTWPDAPLPPADHARITSVADGFNAFAQQLPEASRPAAWRLAARFDAAGGRYERALAAAGRSVATNPRDATDRATHYLLASLEYRAAGRTTDPPIDAYLAWETERRNIPGLSVAVLRDGKPVYMKGFGVADIENRVHATPQTVYRIASVTKTFVATALMMLVEEGKVSLDDPVTRYLKDAPDAWKSITVRHLISHTNGLADIWGVPPAKRPARLGSEQILELLASIPATAAPGERYEYNHGAVLVGVVIERVSGRSLAQFLKERIFDPVGMAHTRLDDPDHVDGDRARNYVWDDARGAHVAAQPLPANVMSLADGGIISTVEDLARWDAALSGDRLLKPETRRTMWAPTRLNDGTHIPYGCGWQIGDVRGHRWVGHFGAGQTSARVSRFVDEGLMIIALTNYDRGDAGRIVDDLARLLLPPGKPADDPDPDSTRRIKEFISGLATAGANPEADATARFYQSQGELRELHFLSQDPKGPRGQSRRFVAVFERGRWVHHVPVDGEGKVTSITIEPE